MFWDLSWLYFGSILAWGAVQVVSWRGESAFRWVWLDTLRPELSANRISCAFMAIPHHVGRYDPNFRPEPKGNRTRKEPE